MLVLAAILAGTLCVDGECRPARRAESPSVQARTFVWIDPDRKNAIAGTIENESLIHSASTESLALSVRLSDTPAREVPVTIDLVSPQQTWSFTLPVKSSLALKLTHPPCECIVRARAPEYRSASGTPDLLLRKLPAIRGVVLDATSSSPLAAAEIALPDGKNRVVSDTRGAFRIVVGDEWPKTLNVTHPARAPKLVPVPKTIADTELPPILLSAGGTVQLTIAAPVGGREPLTWELRSEQGLVRSGAMDTGASNMRIESLDPGMYRVLILGREPLQRFTTRVRVMESQVTTSEIAIRPLVVDGSVTFDGAPIASPTIGVRPHGGDWEVKLTADDDGRFAEELWQPGEYSFSISKEPIVRIWVTDRMLDSDERVQLALDVPNRRVRGRVTETKSGAPIADAQVAIQKKSGRHSVVRESTRTAADGTFELTGIDAGAVELSAMKKGYRFGEPLTFHLGEDESIHEQHLVLEELGVQRTIAVTDARGIPILDAAVFAPATHEWQWIANTDAQGRATVHLASNDASTMVFIIPRSGSLGFVRLSPEEQDVASVRILDNASLEVRMESTDGEPIPRAAVRMRIDGTVIPGDVVSRMAQVQGLSLYSDAAGRIAFPRMPPGQYDILPVLKKADELNPDWPKPTGPATVAVLPGPQTVVMKFKPK